MKGQAVKAERENWTSLAVSQADRETEVTMASRSKAEQTIEALHKVVERLDAAAAKTGAGRRADAISKELSRPVRITAVRSLRDDPVVRRFADELADGLIRVDTAQQLLQVLDRAIGALLIGK